MRVTVLQLDTQFPRIPGDVACPDTYHATLEVLRIPKARVADIVTDRPETIDLAPFKAALAQASGDVIVTSCGFLAPFQAPLATSAAVPFIASALGQLPSLMEAFRPEQLCVLTFDADQLGHAHLPCAPGDENVQLVGLPRDAHLRQVIARDLDDLDTTRAAQEMGDLAGRNIDKTTQAILLECTNLPPFKPQIRAQRDVPIFDILTAIESALPGAVAPQFL